MTAGVWRQLLRSRYPDSEVVRVWPLHGGVSATVTAAELQGPDGPARTVVVRQYGEVDRTHNPGIARDEFRMLKALRGVGLAVPEPILVDESGSLLPGPVLVSGFVPGTTAVAPEQVDHAAVQLAGFLDRLHRVRWQSLDLPDLRRKGSLTARPVRPDETLSESSIRAALEQHWPPSTNPLVLVHGDVWPGNVLWLDDELAAVIDWEDAGVGDPLLDIGNARLELLFFFGTGAMETFTAAYRTRSEQNFASLPIWDLYAALRPVGRMHTWGLEPEVERTMRERHRWFVDQALARLP